MTTPRKASSAANKQLMFTSTDTYKLTNLSDHSVTYHIPNRKFVIGPTEYSQVPFDLVRIYFGDPRSIPGSRRLFKDAGAEGTIASREEEVTRLKTLYGVYGEDTMKLEDAVPQVLIETFDGIEIVPPAFDRLGIHSPQVGKNIADLQNVTDMAAIVAQHEKQLEEMRRMLDTAKINGPNTEDDVEVDTPTTEMD